MSIPPTDDDPLARSEYFLGPIETIVFSHQGLPSGHLSLHDITEAYRTLSMRIRLSSSTLTIASYPLPALEPLRENSANVAAALRRDISRALRAFAPHTPCDMRSSPSEGRVGWEPAAYNVNHATDFSTHCHYVLRLLSEIFRFPALLSVFSRMSYFSQFADPPHDRHSTRPRFSFWGCPCYHLLSTTSILQCIKDHHTRVMGSPDPKTPGGSFTSSNGRCRSVS
jgi:hypothetical protein